MAGASERLLIAMRGGGAEPLTTRRTTTVSYGNRNLSGPVVGRKNPAAERTGRVQMRVMGLIAITVRHVSGAKTRVRIVRWLDVSLLWGRGTDGRRRLECKQLGIETKISLLN